MFKKVTLICLAVFCCTVVVMAQTIKVEPYGVSPRDVESDTMDIFEHAYNGLLNVGVIICLSTFSERWPLRNNRRQSHPRMQRH